MGQATGKGKGPHPSAEEGWPNSQPEGNRTTRLLSGESSAVARQTLEYLKELSLYSDELCLEVVERPRQAEIVASMRGLLGTALGEGGSTDGARLEEIAAAAVKALDTMDLPSVLAVRSFVDRWRDRITAGRDAGPDTSTVPTSGTPPCNDDVPASIGMLSADLLAHVCSFLENPLDIVRTGRVCRLLYVVTSQRGLWERVCRQSVPSFWDWRRCLPRSKVSQDPQHFSVAQFSEAAQLTQGHWKDLYRQYVQGELCCIGQVIEKHQREGVRQSAYDAVCSLKRGTNDPPATSPEHLTFLCEYFRADSDHRPMFHPEELPAERIRAVPEDVKDVSPYELYFPPGFTAEIASTMIGKDVEIQFHFRGYDPFGWWRGVIHSVDVPAGRIKVHFTQFNVSSPWAFEVVVMGERNERGAQRQGVGGIRVCSEGEAAVWKIWYDRWGNRGRDGGALVQLDGPPVPGGDGDESDESDESDDE